MAQPRRGALDRARLAFEFIGLFLLIPTLAVLRIIPVIVIPTLAVAAAACLAVLLRDSRFDRRRLGLGPGAKGDMPPHTALRRIAMWFAVGATAMFIGVVLFDESRLFHLVRTRPELWAIIMVGYPVLSVYPQELIYRAFLFHRYRRVFRGRWPMIIASAVAFGYGHVVFGNTVAVVLSSIGGAIFAITYDRTRSTLLCALEHALYGCFIFTVGLGSYFYAGTMKFAESAAGAAGW